MMRLAIVLLLAAPALADEDHTFDLMNQERLGPLRIGLPAAELAKAVPATAKKNKERFGEADGQYAQSWRYPDQGLELTVVSEKRGGKKTVATIECKATCALRTSRNIGVGSTVIDVRRAYGKDEDKESSNAERFVAGSIYGGVLFDIRQGKVTSIFIGAAAE